MNTKQLSLLAILLVLLLWVAMPVSAATSSQALPETVVTLGTTDIIIILFGLGLLIWSLQKGDAGVSSELARQQERRENMERLERLYQTTSTRNQQTIEMLTSVLRFVAPVTPLRADDAAYQFLEDIRTPGAPADKPSVLEIDRAAYGTPAQETLDPKTLGGGTGDKP